MKKEKIAPHINVNGFVFNTETELIELVTIDLLHEIHVLENTDKDHVYSNPPLNMFWIEKVLGFKMNNVQHPTIYTKMNSSVKVRTNPGKYEFYTDHVSSGKNKTRIILYYVNDLIDYIKLCTGGQVALPIDKIPALNSAFKKYIKDHNSKK